MQGFERGEHFPIREIGVSAARIGQHEDPGTFEPFRLHAEGNRFAAPPLEHHPEQRHPDERDDVGFDAPDLPAERSGAGDVLLRTQGIDAGGRPGNQICNPEAPLGQPAIVFLANRLRHQPGLVEQFPEPIGISGEVMTGGRRPDAGIDANKEDADGSTDAVAQRR